MTKKSVIHVLELSDDDKKRLAKIADKCIVTIDSAKNVEEKAFLLRVLMEGFEEAHNCVIPFKNRYTEPVFNYQKSGMEE